MGAPKGGHASANGRQWGRQWGASGRQIRGVNDAALDLVLDHILDSVLYSRLDPVLNSFGLIVWILHEIYCGLVFSSVAIVCLHIVLSSRLLSSAL